MTQGMDPGSTDNNDNPTPQGRPPVDPRSSIAPPPPPMGQGGFPAMMAPVQPRGRSVAGKIITYILISCLSLSVLANLYLGAIVAAAVRGPQEVVYSEGDEQQRIVIIPIKGMIDNDTYSFIRRSLKHLSENTPKAIILRVDSPGGGVGASDRIWHALSEFRKKHADIPVVASYGSYAASGGYYTSALSDYIFAEPTTITGSIGVIVQAFTAQELLTNIGVKPEVVAATDATMKDVMNWTRDWTERDRDTLKHFLDIDHQRFIDIVYAGRKDHLTREEVVQLATGQPYSILQAIDLKLVDKEGYLDDAIKDAATRAGIPAGVDPHVTVVQPAQSFIQSITSSSASPSLDTITVDRLRSMFEEAATPRMEYRLP